MLSSDVAIVRNPNGKGSKGRTVWKRPDVQQYPGEEEQDVEGEERQTPAERGQPLREPLDGRGLLLHLLVRRDARGRLEQPIRLAEALADDGEHVERGARVLLEQSLERGPVDLHRSGRCHRHGVGGPFPAIEQRQLAEEVTRPELAEHSPSSRWWSRPRISTAPRAMT